MDGEFAALELLDALSPYLIAVTRLRLDARLFDPPLERPGSIRTLLKGVRQPTLRARLADRATIWRRAVLSNRTRWRSGRWIDYASGTALWYHPGKPVVPILWVLVRYPDGRREPEAFLCTDPTVPPRTVLEWFNHRWAMETTYEESRAHLGVESQRQWSDKAVSARRRCCSACTRWSPCMSTRMPSGSPCRRGAPSGIPSRRPPSPTPSPACASTCGSIRSSRRSKTTT